MNILRLVAAEKEKKLKPPSAAFQKLDDEASVKDQGVPPVRVEKVELQKILTPVAYHVTQNKGTERAFSGKYLRQKEEGVYSCIICDNVLFTSQCKYDHMCGWPSFSDVAAQGRVSYKKDTTNGMQRIEVQCSQCGGHLGHVFDDGPKKNNNIRYCVNSASLNFKKHTTV